MYISIKVSYSYIAGKNICRMQASTHYFIRITTAGTMMPSFDATFRNSPPSFNGFAGRAVHEFGRVSVNPRFCLVSINGLDIRHRG